MRAQVSVMVLAALLFGGASAGEAGSTKSIFSGRPDPLYVKAERVDPFTLGKSAEPPPPTTRWQKILAMLSDRRPAVRLRGTGELLSLETADRFDRCLAECRKQVSVLKLAVAELREKPELAPGKLDEFRALLEKYRRLTATARRLKRHEEIRSEFAAMKVTVEGIVWREGGRSSATVNGRALTEGGVLRLRGKKGPAVRVRRVGRKSVVFLYRGLEVTVKL